MRKFQWNTFSFQFWWRIVVSKISAQIISSLIEITTLSTVANRLSRLSAKNKLYATNTEKLMLELKFFFSSESSKSSVCWLVEISVTSTIKKLLRNNCELNQNR